MANFLTRRIHQRYVRQMDVAVGKKADEPHPLVIIIEEAHKFLDPAIAGQTIFGTIARELRKYNVTLLVVDQRPSGIDEEVMSQIGTRITCLLDNEADIRAVFSGVSGAGDAARSAGPPRHAAAGPDPGPRRADAGRRAHRATTMRPSTSGWGGGDQGGNREARAKKGREALYGE